MSLISLIFIVSVLLFMLLLIRTFMIKEKDVEQIVLPDLKIDVEGAARRLSGAVQIKTIACSDASKTDLSAFTDFREYLQRTYPVVHGVMTLDVVNGVSLLYRWHGKSADKKPAIFLAHIDVVPVESGTESGWKYPPFSGTVTGEAVWGRGTQDIKNQLIAILESAETVISSGFVPERDIYFAFGHDEETRRSDGADIIAKLLADRGIKFEYLLDEGGQVIDNAVPGIMRPVAFIGIAEKGFVNIRMSAKSSGGHSSMPPAHTAAGIVSRAVARIESKKMPLKLTDPVKGMFRALAPAAGFGTRFFLSNLWLFAPVFKTAFARSDPGSAFLRTTIAPTMLDASDAPNVLPLNASAVVNARILHGDSSLSLKRRLEKVTGDKTLSIEMSEVYEPSKISPVDSYGYKSIEKTIRSLWPMAVITPYLVVGGTDARKYEDLTDCVYRFTPMRLDNNEMKQVHGTDEHISMKNIEDSVRFYTMMFRW